MAFKGWDPKHLARFNSAISSKFLETYESYVDECIKGEASTVPHRTFAPSAFRCDRRSWFRLRGVEPDVIKTPDAVLNFSAEIGTACHRMIQRNLRDMLKSDWINVMNYVYDFKRSDTYYNCVPTDDELETFVSTENPPVRFACDGIIRLKDKLYLLEIKSSEYGSWNELTDPKPHHIDQVKCYCTLLHLDDVIFMYIDRQYGGIKCFEYHVSKSDKDSILERFQRVQDMVRMNLAPSGLPKGDSWCTPSMCPYYTRCGEYGR